MTLSVDQALRVGRERLAALDRERVEVRATIASLQAASGGPDGYRDGPGTC